MLACSNLKLILVFFLLTACQTSVQNLDVADEHIALKGDLMLYKEKPFSGTLYSKIDSLKTFEAIYKDGKKHGREQKYFFNGDTAEVRFYTNGEKSGIHRSWWDKKQLKSQYQYDNSGNYIGLQYEWYRNGQLAKELNYTDGQEDGTQRLWDFKGKITANYEVINGERFGFIGSKDCKYGFEIE